MTAWIDPGEQRKGRKRNQNNGLYGVASLFDAPSVPRPTSEDAADRQGRQKRTIDRLRILQMLCVTPDGLTRDQIADATAISPNTVRPRIVELITLGHVHDQRITRLTVTGSKAAVCEITVEGIAYLQEHVNATR